MKRIISFIILSAMILSLSACNTAGNTETSPSALQTTAAPTTVATEPVTEVPESLKILAIGNSFSVDTTWHLYNVAKAEGIKNIVIGNMFVGSCTLVMHVDNAKNNNAAYVYYKNTQGDWMKTPDTTLEYALQDEQWDIIVMQQASKDSGMPDSYTPYVDKLIEYVDEKVTNKDYKLYWNMTWAYQGDYQSNSFVKYGNNQSTMYECITKAVQAKIVNNEAFDGVIPVGTVIQNARTGMGDTLTRDGTHLSEFGRLLGAYTWYCTFTNQTLTEVKLKNFNSKALTKDEKDLIIKTVNGALEAPFEITKAW